MTEHLSSADVLRGFAAWNSGDMDVLREYLSDDAILHFAGDNAMSGTYRGQDAMMDALARAIQGWGSHTDVESVLVSDDHLMVFHHGTGEHEGTPYDVMLVIAMKLGADGKVTEVWFLPNDQRGYDRFWS
jgi:ketosteroid isomerase-like protein